MGIQSAWRAQFACGYADNLNARNRTVTAAIRYGICAVLSLRPELPEHCAVNTTTRHTRCNAHTHTHMHAPPKQLLSSISHVSAHNRLTRAQTLSHDWFSHKRGSVSTSIVERIVPCRTCRRIRSTMLEHARVIALGRRTSSPRDLRAYGSSSCVCMCYSFHCTKHTHQQCCSRVLLLYCAAVVVLSTRRQRHAHRICVTCDAACSVGHAGVKIRRSVAVGFWPADWT